MWMPKGCERCGGDLYKVRTDDGVVASCLQCGRETLSEPARPSMTREEIYALFHDDRKRARKAA